MRQFVEICEKAARAGGQVLLDWQGKISVREKGPKDLVTEADLASQQVIKKMLLGEFPDHRFLGEEDQPDHAATDDRDEGYCWICDPLDGTTNYVHHLPNYAVSIGLRRADEMLVGVVFDPTTNECFSAVQGGGAYLNGQPIRVSDCTELSQALVAVSLPPHVARDAPEVEQFLDVLVQCQALRRLGSPALNLSYLAAGRLDGYWAVNTKIWDIAAGVLLVQEAGGQVSSSRGGTFEREIPGFVAAASSELRRELMALIGSPGVD